MFDNLDTTETETETEIDSKTVETIGSTPVNDANSDANKEGKLTKKKSPKPRKTKEEQVGITTHLLLYPNGSYKKVCVNNNNEYVDAATEVIKNPEIEMWEIGREIKPQITC